MRQGLSACSQGHILSQMNPHPHMLLSCGPFPYSLYNKQFIMQFKDFVLWDEVLSTRQYGVNVFIITTITTPVLTLFSITGCRHAVPLYDGAVYRDQSSVAYHRQWHLCVGVWTRVKLALTLLLLEQKCSGTWHQKPATGCILVNMRATCFLKIFFKYYQPTFLEALIGLILYIFCSTDMYKQI